VAAIKCPTKLSEILMKVFKGDGMSLIENNKIQSTAGLSFLLRNPSELVNYGKFQ
jgi:hypothetical protein